MRPYSDFAAERQISNRIRLLVIASFALAIVAGIVGSGVFHLNAGLLFVIIPTFVIAMMGGLFGWIEPLDRQGREAFTQYLASLDIDQVLRGAFDPALSPSTRLHIREYLEKTWPQWSAQAAL